MENKEKNIFNEVMDYYKKKHRNPFSDEAQNKRHQLQTIDRLLRNYKRELSNKQVLETALKEYRVIPVHLLKALTIEIKKCENRIKELTQECIDWCCEANKTFL